MRAFIQVLDRDQARQALANIGRVTEAGGMIYIVDKIVSNSRIEPADAVLMNINFLNVFDGGQAYTEGEHREWLMQAGFEDVNFTHAPGGDSIVSARKR